MIFFISLNSSFSLSAAARCDVDHLCAGVNGFAGPERSVDDICHLGEITGLFAVAMDLRRTVLEQRGCKHRDDSRVGRRRILARAEDIEVADADGLETMRPS